MSWPYPYFTKKEMSCPCGCKGLPQDSFMDKLVTVREECGFPFIINSAYRCPEYNKKIAHSGLEGPHTLGLAADIRVYGERALKVIQVGLKHGMTGIGIQQNQVLPFRSRYLHIDSVENILGYSRPWIWSY